MRLWSVMIIYERKSNEAGIRTLVTTQVDGDAAIRWLSAEVERKGELPGYRIARASAEDISEQAYAFVAANPRGAQ